MKRISRRDRARIEAIAANVMDALQAEQDCLRRGDLLQAADWAETAEELSGSAFRIAQGKA